MNMNTNNVPLSQWQKKQAALLYHFSSLAYLRSVKDRVDALMDFAANTLDKAARENRDGGLKSRRWGNRDTSQNWGDNAWAFLADFQQGLAKDIANRSIEAYSVTGRNHCARGMAEFSMEWTTLDEQARFDQIFAEASARASNIDLTMNRVGPVSKWTDYSLAVAWKENAHFFPKLPMLRVRQDVFAETGVVPVRTGVYFCADDPNASLQFAWTGGGGGKLLASSTFNDLGEAALAAVGRPRLWLDEQAMLDFVMAKQNHPGLRSDSFFADSQIPALAPSLVARQAFTARACKWHYIEMIHDEFEEIMDDENPAVGAASGARFAAGASCPMAGFYFTPARLDSRRYFATGEVFPEEASGYGATFWQFDKP
jgi:hypothetical protein